MNDKLLSRPVQKDLASIKGIDAKARTIECYASTNDLDRYGEKFMPDAFAGDGIAAYLKNPVVLWAHDYSTPPLGKAIDHSFDSKGLILLQQFADHQMAKDIFALYEGGYMNAFSVGFIPKEVAYEEKAPGYGDMGVVFKKAELLENSAVPVPANPGALVIKGLMGAAQRVFSPKVAISTDWQEFEAWRSSQREFDLAKAELAAAEGAPSLKSTLSYMIGLAKIVKFKGKVADDETRSLLIQANNLCRELVYGAGAEPVAPEGELTGEAVAALVKEYETLSEIIIAKGDSADPKDVEEFQKVGELIESLLAKSKNLPAA